MRERGFQVELRYANQLTRDFIAMCWSAWWSIIPSTAYAGPVQILVARCSGAETAEAAEDGGGLDATKPADTHATVPLWSMTNGCTSLRMTLRESMARLQSLLRGLLCPATERAF